MSVPCTVTVKTIALLYLASDTCDKKVINNKLSEKDNNILTKFRAQIMSRYKMKRKE